LRLEKITFILFLLLLPLTAFALSTNPSEFKGSLQVSLNKTAFNAGETLNAEITALSMEAVPIAEASLIVELVKGGEFYYPSTLSDVDNVFFEQRIDGINLRAAEAKTVNFSYTLPENLASGNYRIDVYFRTERSPIVGITHIFNNPKSINFTVKNKNSTANFPSLKIVRTKTVFNDSESIQTLQGTEPEGIGPIGPPVKPDSTITGKVFVQNASKTEEKNIEVFAGLCEWDDSLCTSFLSEKTAIIDSIPANSEKTVELQLQAPSKHTAFAIRLEVRKDGKVVSLYRNRAVVIGEGARVRKLYSNNVELEAGKPASFNVLLSPSADHWLQPEFRDFSLKFSVEDLKTAGKLFEKTENIPLIDYKINFLEKAFEFTPKTELLNYKICASIEKSGAVIDNYCTVYDSNKFSKLVNFTLETSWDRKQNNSLLELKFCTKPENKDINANFTLVTAESLEFAASESFAGTNCVEKSLTVDSSKKFKLAVTDFIAKTQKVYEIELKPAAGAEGTQTGSNQISIFPSGVGGLLLVIELLALLLAIVVLFVSLKIIQKKRGRKK